MKPLAQRLKDILITPDTNVGVREALSMKIESVIFGLDIDTVRSERQRDNAAIQWLIRSIKSQRDCAAEELHAMVTVHIPTGAMAEDVKLHAAFIDTCDDTIASLERSLS